MYHSWLIPFRMVIGFHSNGSHYKVLRSVRKWQVLVHGKLVEENKREQIEVSHAVNPPPLADMQRLFEPTTRKSEISHAPY